MRRLSSWTCTATTGSKHTATIYRDTEWEEFVVKLSTDGKHHAKADYHTGDKQDALMTAKAMARQSARVTTEPTTTGA